MMPAHGVHLVPYYHGMSSSSLSLEGIVLEWIQTACLYPKHAFFRQMEQTYEFVLNSTLIESVFPFLCLAIINWSFHELLLFDHQVRIFRVW